MYNCADARKSFPKLTTIGGCLNALVADTKTTFPKLKHKNSDKAKQIAGQNLSRSLLKSGHMLQDEILSQHLASRKLSNGLIVHTGIIVGKDVYKTSLLRTTNDEGFTIMRSVIKDDCIFHVWKCNECVTKVEVAPDFYEESGIPVCEECGDDMAYCRTEIEIPIEPNNTFLTKRRERK